MKRQFGQMQIAQGVAGNITFFMPQAIRDRLQDQLLGISFPMPAAIRERINVALAVMEPRFREFCRIRTHIATLPARRLEHLALWQKWHPGRNIDEYVMPAFLNEPDQPRVVPTAQAFIIQDYTVKVSDIADNPPPHLRALQTVQPRPAKRKANVLSPIDSHVPFKSVFSHFIDPKAKSIEVAHIDHSRVPAAMRYNTMETYMPGLPVQSTLGPDYLYDSPPASLASSSTHSSPSMGTVSIPFHRGHLQQDFVPPPNDASARNNIGNLEVVQYPLPYVQYPLPQDFFATNAMHFGALASYQYPINDPTQFGVAAPYQFYPYNGSATFNAGLPYQYSFNDPMSFAGSTWDEQHPFVHSNVSWVPQTDVTINSSANEEEGGYSSQSDEETD